jgi:SnoaL-like polyketide cyclase
MSAQDNTAIVRRFWEEALGQGRLEVVDQIFSSDCTVSAAGLFDGEISGPAEVREVVEQTRNAFPDLQISIDDLATTEYGDVVTTWRGTSTSGEWWGQSASRLHNDKIVKMWWAMISHGADDDTWTAMELDSVVVLVGHKEMVPDQEYYKKRPKSLHCCLFDRC